MKFMTINIHSHDREFDEAVLISSMERLASFVKENGVDVLALQEASQEMNRPFVSGALPGHCVIRDAEHSVREGNAALVLAKMLEKTGESWYWAWAGTKLGYERFEEGLALFSRKKMENAESFWISGIRDFNNWKSRKALRADIVSDTERCQIYSVHMGWWNDPEEQFKGQMERLQAMMPDNRTVYLMGDFNSPAGVKGEGWQMVKDLGWHDTYELAEDKDDGITVPGSIDGWRDGDYDGMRLDYIWCSEAQPVQRSKVVLNGRNGPVISDHFGVLIEQ